MKRELSLADFLAKAEHYCAYQERCSFDTIQKLHTWGADHAITTQVIEQLKRDKFINDQRFANTYALSKLKYNKWGKRKIAYSLFQKKINSTLIDNALSSIPTELYDEVAIALIAKKTATTNEKNRYKKKEKILAYLAGKGFELEHIIPLLEDSISTDD